MGCQTGCNPHKAPIPFKEGVGAGKALSVFLAIVAIWASFPTKLDAQINNELIQKFTHGGINWTAGKIFASCEYAPTDDHFGQPVNPDQALRGAQSNLLAILRSMRIDAHTRLANYSADRGTILAQIEPMVAQAAITHREYLSDGSLKIALEMDILGGLAQLVLPPEIRPVELIKPVHSDDPLGTDAPQIGSTGPIPPAGDRSHTKPYTGLVLDARGLKIQPALVPLVRDPDNEEVYGPAFVSREYVVQQGMALYLREITGIRAHPRVRFNPLIIKCLPGGETTPDTDLLISDQDAALLRSASESLAFLRECRVIIVVD